MIWAFIVYGLVLVYLATHQDKVKDKSCLRPALSCFALIPFAYFFFTIIRVSNLHGPEPEKLVVTELWSTGISCLLLGISLLFLINALIPKEVWNPMKKQ